MIHIIKETFVWREFYYVNEIKLKRVRSSNLFKLEVDLIRLVMSKLKRIDSLSFLKSETTVMFKLKIVKSLNSSKSKVKLIKLVISKLKRLCSSNSLESEKELVRLVVFKLKKVISSSFFKLEIKLIRLIISKLKIFDSLKFSKLELKLVRRTIIESISSLILIRKVVLIYNELSIRKEIQTNVITDLVQDAIVT